MKIKIRNINEKTVKDLFSPCKVCIYWEEPKKCGQVSEDEAFTIKKRWFKKTRTIFGNCGKILYADGNAAAYTQYCLPHLLENVAEYSHLFPVSPDAILISCLYVCTGYRKKGLGTNLLHTVINELREREYHAVETYSRDDSPNNCSGPTTFYLKNGFTLLKREKWGNAIFSLVRFEL